MKMRKSLIAVAVASVCAAPMAAQADPQLWGEFIAGVESNNGDKRGDPDADGELVLDLDSASFGIETEEDLGNGLSIVAGTEVEIEDGDSNGLALAADSTFAAISGDFGSLLAGWGVDSAYYLHVQEVTDRGFIYDTYSLADATLPDGTEVGIDTVSNALQYGYDGGAFQLTAELVMNAEPINPATNDGDTENFDRMSVGASFDAGVVSVGVATAMTATASDDNAATANVDESAEPSITGVSVGGEFGGFNIGANYQMVDPDVSGGPEPTAIDVVASTDLGGGMGAMLGFSSYDSDADDDADSSTTINAQLSQALSERTVIFGQLQTQSIDGGDAVGAEDEDPQSIYVGIEHAF